MSNIVCFRFIETDSLQASRQAALQKALSTALLNHQISELESKVQSIQVLKQQDPAAPAVNGHVGKAKVARVNGDSSNRDIAAKNVNKEVQERGRDTKAGLGRIDDDPAEVAAALTHDEDIEPVDIDDEEEGEQWRVVVLDASALIWALRSIRRLSSKGWELVVPIDGASCTVSQSETAVS